MNATYVGLYETHDLWFYKHRTLECLPMKLLILPNEVIIFLLQFALKCQVAKFKLFISLLWIF